MSAVITDQLLIEPKINSVKQLTLNTGQLPIEHKINSVKWLKYNLYYKYWSITD